MTTIIFLVFFNDENDEILVDHFLNKVASESNWSIINNGQGRQIKIKADDTVIFKVIDKLTELNLVYELVNVHS